MHLKIFIESSCFVNCQYAQKAPNLSWLSEVSLLKPLDLNNDVNVPGMTTSEIANCINPYFHLHRHIELLRQSTLQASNPSPTPGKQMDDKNMDFDTFLKTNNQINTYSPEFSPFRRPPG